MHVLDGKKALQYLETLTETLAERYNNECSYEKIVSENDIRDISYTDFLINRQIIRLLEAEKYLLNYQKQGHFKPKISVDRNGFPSIPSLESDLEFMKKEKKKIEKVTSDNRIFLTKYKLIQSCFEWEQDGIWNWENREKEPGTKEKAQIFHDFLRNNKKRSFNDYIEK